MIVHSFPGLGETTAAILVSETGEYRSRFRTADVLLAETGTARSPARLAAAAPSGSANAANKQMRRAIGWWAFVLCAKTVGPARPTRRAR